jgi:DNA-binding HxlR family transcriptional regulator
MRKTSSTNALNEKELKEYCGMTYTFSVLGGRWKANIIYKLFNGKMRYSELKRSIPNVSERILVAQLREMEKDQLLRRIVYAEVPPRVEYELTTLGLSLKPMMKVISDWGNMHKGKMAKSGETLYLK